MAIKSEDQILDELALLHIQKKGFHWLHFPPEIEKRFKKYYIEAFLFQARISLYIGFIIFGFFGYLDWHFQPHTQTPDMYSYFNLLAYYFPLPILLSLGLPNYSPRVKPYQQFFLVTMMIAIGVVLILLATRTEDDINDYYFMGLLLLEMLFFTSSRMRFWHAVFCVVFLFGFYNLFYGFVYSLPKNEIFILNFFYVSGSILSLLACYFIERSIRKEYISNHLLELQGIKLNQAILQLEHFASIDALTQIPNRRTFDKCLKEEWNRCKRSHLPITLMMMDIDSFKKYNDSYGHLQGDECLKKIALLIQSHAKRAGDLAARFGGEEFALILPNTRKEEALFIAKSILEGLKEEGIKHEQALNGDKVSLSIGIITVYPKEASNELNVTSLIQLADERLYEAKHQGGACFK
jgi:diguanylate cyclase (GGDEF)-like protein